MYPKLFVIVYMQDLVGLRSESSGTVNQLGILESFINVLKTGLKVRIHDLQTAKKCLLWMEDGRVIYWRPTGFLSTAKKNKKSTLSLDLVDVLTIHPGKEKFQRDCEDVEDNFCLSMVLTEGAKTPIGTNSLDIQFQNELVRDAMLEGFNMLLQDIHENEINV